LFAGEVGLQSGTVLRADRHSDEHGDDGEDYGDAKHRVVLLMEIKSRSTGWLAACAHVLGSGGAVGGVNYTHADGEARCSWRQEAMWRPDFRSAILKSIGKRCGTREDYGGEEKYGARGIDFEAV
jgi:hypothetical protein